MKQINWGIIGFGRFGAVHASVINSIPGCTLTAVCNHNPERLAAASQNIPGVICTDRIEPLLERADIDAVSITTHWKQHFEPAKAALLAGKHVLLEKPMAETSDQCRELVQIASDCNAHLMVGHVCRFDPRAALACEAVHSGRIGRIVSMHAKRNLPVAPGNIRLNKISPLMGDGIHDADLMLWLMRRMPSQVYARNIRVHEFAYADIGWAMLSFDDDAVGVIETNWCLPRTVDTVIDARLEVVGTDGMITVDCSNTGFLLTDADGRKMSDTVYWPQIHNQRVGALRSEFEYFTTCIREGRRPQIITPEDGWRAVAVMESAEISATSGLPVAVPTIPNNTRQSGDTSS